MKLICKQKDLAYALNIVEKAVSSKTTQHILKGILLEAKNGKIKLTGSDLKICIEKSINAEIEEEGSTVVISKVFGEFIRKLPDEDIKLTLLNNELSIDCFKSHIKLITFDSFEYPELPKIGTSNIYKINKSLLKTMIKQTIFATSQDETRPILTGSFIEIKNNNISMVAIDGFRVAVKNASINSTVESSAVIPAKTLNEINKLISLNDNNEIIDIFISDKIILFNFDKIKVISRLLEGDYVKYAEMLNTEYKSRIEIKTEDLLHSIERVALLSRESKNNSIKLSIKNNYLKIDSIVEIGNANEEIPLKLEGNELEIGFSPKYLIDVLKVIDSEYIYIEFITNINPCIIKPTNNNNYKYLLLPVRIPNI